MRFGLHLLRKVIKKKSFLIRRAYHSRVLKPEQTEMMEGEGVRVQGTGEPGGKAEEGKGRRERRGEGGRGQIRWDWFCHNVVQEAGGNAAAPKQRDAPAALQRENFNLSRKRRSLPTIFNLLEQTSRPFLNKALRIAFFLFPDCQIDAAQKEAASDSFPPLQTLHPAQTNAFGRLQQLLAVSLLLRLFTDGCPQPPQELCNYGEVYSSIVTLFSRIKT